MKHDQINWEKAPPIVRFLHKARIATCNEDWDELERLVRTHQLASRYALAEQMANGEG